MSYRRGTQLGWIAAIPVAVESFKAIESTLFGSGSSRDAQRQARCDWFTTAALGGSVTAARILLGGTVKTAGNESPMYVRAISIVDQQAPDIMNAARDQGQYWVDGDDATSTQMRAAVTRELNSLGALSPPTLTTGAGSGGYTFPTSPAPRPQVLPGVTTTAAFNWTPFLIGGGALALLVLSGGLRPSRRR